MLESSHIVLKRFISLKTLKVSVNKFDYCPSLLACQFLVITEVFLVSFFFTFWGKNCFVGNILRLSLHRCPINTVRSSSRPLKTNSFHLNFKQPELEMGADLWTNNILCMMVSFGKKTMETRLGSFREKKKTTVF